MLKRASGSDQAAIDDAIDRVLDEWPAIAAGDMQAELKGIYNRKRQEGITKDLLDIVGGAEALR